MNGEYSNLSDANLELEACRLKCMVRVLIVSHSARDRNLTLWKSVLKHNANAELVVPILEKEKDHATGLGLLDHPRVSPLDAIEPFGRGHSAMWIKKLLYKIENGNYDLVHAAFEPWALVPQLLCGRVPTVVHAAESVVANAPLTFRLRRVGIHRVLTKAAGFLTWGQSSLDAFREAGLPLSTPQGVIPGGIPDPEFFTPEPIDQTPGPLRLLFVGRLVQEKGILTLLKAVGEFGRPTHLRVFGVGPLENSLADRAATYPDLDLSLEGFGTAGQIAEAMAWSQAVVVPSESNSYWHEQWGRVAVEAMLSGRPTIVSDSGELPNLVLEPELVFPAGNTESLASILSKLHRDSRLLDDLGVRLRASAERFAPDKLALELNAFWEGVADRSS